MKGLIFATLLFGLVVWARYEVFDLDAPKPTAALYDKPVWMRMLAVPRAQSPSGYNLTTVENPAPVDAATAHQQVPRLSQAGFPQPGEIKEYLVQSWAGTMGDKVNLVTARYHTKEALEQAGGGRMKPPRYHVVDYYLTWIDVGDDAAAPQFHDMFDAHVKAQKKKRVDMEKVVVASNAYLKLFADVLVGAFGFMLALFFAKYFLIVRNVED
jgi:hypothetical protein